MKEKLFCIVTPQARSYYKASCVAKEFLDKDGNLINTTGSIPDGEVAEFSVSTATVKHFEAGKLHGRLEVINLADKTVTFSEDYDHGQLIRVSDHTLFAAKPKKEEKPAPLYPGTIFKTTKDGRVFFANGKQIAEETLSANGATIELLGTIPDGDVKEFTENGKLKTEATYLHNKLHGVLVRYDEQGRVSSKETYHQGLLNGTAQYYSYSAYKALNTQCGYKNALLEGDLTVTQQDGTVRERAHYAGGKLQGPRTTYYSNGTLETEETFQDGKLQGPRTLYFPTSQVWYTEKYVAGRLDGERNEYFASGKIRLTELYSDGMLNGQRNTYSEDGNLIASEEYHWGNIIHNTEYRPL